MSRRCSLLALALVLAAGSAPAQAGCCPEPSALDLEPAVEALRVQHDAAAGELVLTWQDLGTSYRVEQGDLDQLHRLRRLEVLTVDAPSLPTSRLLLPPGQAYLLLGSTCGALRCSLGRDSDGSERAFDLGCRPLEEAALYLATAACLSQSGENGVVRSAAEYDAFAACFAPGNPTLPAPPGAGEAIVWATDFSSAACDTCFEIRCVRSGRGDLTVETAGGPWGDCDALHWGGAWARVLDEPVIRFEHLDEPAPLWPSCR